jgi:cytochrome c biogenesis protein CcmG/thiol:disulfide interchange protein DsbE
MAGRAKLVLQAAAVAVVGLLFVLLAFEMLKDEEALGLAKAVDAGEQPAAPSLELPSLRGGETISLASFRGKAVVLNFWASWCVPCKEETPMLQTAWERGRDRGLVVLGVNAQDFKRDARRFVDRYGLTYPIVHDGSGSSLGRWGLTGFPETWWVGRNGRLVAYKQGPFTAEELDRNIELALEAA